MVDGDVTPTPCVHGHQRRRTAKGRNYCPTCNDFHNSKRKSEISAYKKRWESDNPDRVRESRRRNSPKYKEKKDRWYRDNRERLRQNQKIYRANLHYLFGTWLGMNYRCYVPGATNFENYGGKGVGVHNGWRLVRGKRDVDVIRTNATHFRNFVEYIETNLGPRPDGHTLDRYPDFKGNYEPGNIRWANAKDQANNRSTNKHNRQNVPEHTIVETDVLRRTLSQIAEDEAIDLAVVKDRYAKFGHYDHIVNKGQRVDCKYRYNGHLYSLYELALIADLPYTLISSRLHSNKWSVNKAVETQANK